MSPKWGTPDPGPNEVAPEGYDVLSASQVVDNDLLSTVYEALDSLVLPAMRKGMTMSVATVLIVPQSPDTVDAKSCLELGTVLYLGKPILAVVHPGALIPPQLLRVADEVIHVDITTEEGRAAFQDAVRNLTRRYDELKGREQWC